LNSDTKSLGIRSTLLYTTCIFGAWIFPNIHTDRPNESHRSSGWKKERGEGGDDEMFNFSDNHANDTTPTTLTLSTKNKRAKPQITA
jgi:hypothetical protein